MSSKCCNAETHVGYYNGEENPNSLIAIGTLGTYCNNCGNVCETIDDKGNEYTANGRMKPKEKPLVVYVIYDPSYETPICVHDKPDMQCSVCGKRKYKQRLCYQLVERKFVVKTGKQLKKLK